MYNRENNETARSIIDLDDVEKCKKYKWGLSNGYVASRWCKAQKKAVATILHRYIMECPIGKEVDHKNGNKLDNRKSNLRICGRGENQRNMRATGKTSIYKGVHWYEKAKAWRVKLTHDGRELVSCIFECEIAAANAYNHYALMYHGEFAMLNKVEFMSIEQWEDKRRKTHNTSGHKGVSIHKKTGKWRSRYNDKTIGYFDTFEEACISRQNYLHYKTQLEMNGGF